MYYKEFFCISMREKRNHIRLFPSSQPQLALIVFLNSSLVKLNLVIGQRKFSNTWVVGLSPRHLLKMDPNCKIKRQGQSFSEQWNMGHECYL